MLGYELNLNNKRTLEKDKTSKEGSDPSRNDESYDGEDFSERDLNE